MNVDGIVGDKTKAAIKRYQKDNDLYVSGIVDDQLLKCLDKDVGEGSVKKIHW